MITAHKHQPATKNKHQRGFTLIELLVVVGIIGVLSTMAGLSLIRARQIAKLNKAAGDVSNYVTAIMLLGEDTGKWPNGCPLESVSNPEIQINAASAGLTQQPSVGDYGDGCFWSSSDIAKWNGPYAQAVSDPWGNDYWFDPDYRPYNNCASEDDGPEVAVVMSFGPNGVGVNVYDCDDIFKQLP